MLYIRLVTPELQHVSVVWNSVTNTDPCLLECVQRKFVNLCYNRLFDTYNLRLGFGQFKVVHFIVERGIEVLGSAITYLVI
jgi:hypothetical protein